MKPAQEPVNPFKVANHPPSVVPTGASTMAQDEDINASAQWASSALSGIFADGVTFLGYPYLAELAQRPEYRRISETLATEMTRKWVKLQAAGDKDKTEKLKQLEAAMKRLKVQSAFRKAAEQDGFFGRSHIYLDFGTTDDRDELKTPIGDGGNDISKNKIKKGSLKRLKTVEPVWCYPTDYNSNDPLRPDWYKPSSWFVQGTQIHSSRLLTFVGREVPDLLKPAYSFGGLSMSQMAKPYVDNWVRTRQSVADLIHSFSVNGIKIDLAEALQVSDANGGELFKRIDLFNRLRDNRGTMVLNAGEEFFNVSTPLGTLDALQAQTQEHMAAVSGIPIVKLLGIQPMGLNASSEGEIRVFYDWIHAYQELLFADQLNRVLGFIQLSEFGEVDPDISFKFVDLWQLDEIERATLRKTDAETGKILIEGKTLSRAEERKRIASDPEAPYASLDTDILPAEPLSETDKATIAVNITNAVATAFGEQLIDHATALRALKQSSLQTDLFTDISDEDIAEAELEAPVSGETDLPEPPGLKNAA
jgi:phage-related protein (TIGR01555 family)